MVEFRRFQEIIYFLTQIDILHKKKISTYICRKIINSGDILQNLLYEK